MEWTKNEHGERYKIIRDQGYHRPVWKSEFGLINGSLFNRYEAAEAAAKAEFYRGNEAQIKRLNQNYK